MKRVVQASRYEDEFTLRNYKTSKEYYVAIADYIQDRIEDIEDASFDARKNSGGKLSKAFNGILENCRSMKKHLQYSIDFFSKSYSVKSSQDIKSNSTVDPDGTIGAAWDVLVGLGVSEETLQVVTSLNGYSYDTLNDVCRCVFGDDLEDHDWQLTEDDWPEGMYEE